MAGIPKMRLTSVSINATNTVADLSKLENRTVEQLTQERLEQLWKELQEHSSGDEKLCNLLADKEVELKNNNLFHIKVPNLYFDSLFREYQTRILGFLREQTNNESLQFKVVVVVEQVEHKAYLPREKFDVLLQENPAMLSLRKLFPDIDF